MQFVGARENRNDRENKFSFFFFFFPFVSTFPRPQKLHGVDVDAFATRLI